MKQGVLMTAVIFVATLGLIFGIRASTDALAVVLGVILGVVASVPMTALVTYILMRSQASQATQATHASIPMPNQPPVVIINTPDKPAISAPPTLSSPQATIQARKWTVIGDEDTAS